MYPNLKDIFDVIDACETWNDEGDGPVFEHSTYILRRENDGRFFLGQTPKQADPDGTTPWDIDTEGLELTELPADHLWPPFDAKFTRGPRRLLRSVFIKRQRHMLPGWDENDPTQKLADLVLHEVEICELLAKHPHPHVAQYLGCLIEDGRITGLCFRRYDMTLKDKVSSGDPFDKEACLRGIEDGIKHLHRLGLVHNDLYPDNVMVDRDGANPVIIDFGCCRQEGQEVPFTRGSNPWPERGFTHSNRQSDLDDLAKIKELLMGTDGAEGKQA
jgi:serine/threonine protein kinase